MLEEWKEVLGGVCAALLTCMSASCAADTCMFLQTAGQVLQSAALKGQPALMVASDGLPCSIPGAVQQPLSSLCWIALLLPQHELKPLLKVPLQSGTALLKQHLQMLNFMLELPKTLKRLFVAPLLLRAHE